MLKIRIIPTLLHKNFGLVKGVAFDSWRRVGSAMQSIKVYSIREVDEIIFLDITATLENREPDFQVVDELADECFMPLTVGGGVRSIDDVYRLLMVGADKISINSAVTKSMKLIEEASKRFGSQCIVVSIDYRRIGQNRCEVFSHSGTRPTGLEPVELAKMAENCGAGEILLTSIDRDGTMSGYDMEIISRVTGELSIPIIASGGAGKYQDMLDVLQQGKVSAVAAASIYHFTEQTPFEAKLFLKSHGIPVRL
jgi:cyclase